MITGKSVLTLLQRPLFWLGMYFFVLIVLSAAYYNSLNSSNTFIINETSTTLNPDNQVVISIPGADVSEPAYLSIDATNRRAIIGNIPMTGKVFGVAIVGAKAYVTTLKNGIGVYDLTSPLNPVRVDTVRAENFNLRSNADEKFLYLNSNRYGLQLYPIDPNSSLRKKLSLIHRGNARASIRNGDNIYVASGRDGLTTFKIFKAAHGTLGSGQLHRLPLPGVTADLVLMGDFIIAASGSGGLHLIDFTNKSSPTLLQTVAAQKKYERVWLVDNVLYASQEDQSIEHFRIVDRSLQLVGRTLLQGKIHGVLLAGSRLYISESAFGVSVLDVSDPEHPQRIGFVGTPGEPRGLALYEGYLYVASDTQGVQIVDTSRFEPFKSFASFNTPEYALDIVLDNQWLFVADGESGLQVLDRRDRGQLRAVASLQTKYRAEQLVKVGDLVFLSLKDHGLVLIDVSDPLHPELVTDFDIGTNLSDMKVRGLSLFACSASQGLLYRIDISDPAHLQISETVSIPGRPFRMALAGDDVFIASQRSGLFVARFVSGQPGEIIARLNRPWPMSEFMKSFGIVIRGKYAYMIQGENGVQVIDIDNPRSPEEVAFVPLPGRGLVIAVTETYVVVSTSRKGYYFIDISLPGKPHLAAHIYAPRGTHDFVIDGDRLYAAGRSNGINVLPLPIKSAKTSGFSSSSLTFNRPQLPGWYDLNTRSGNDLVRSEAVLKVE